jgi:drug/metabolite transporter (DMT)-like permease
MGGALLSFSLMAVAVRELLRAFGTFEILFLRSVVSLAVMLVLLPRFGAGALRTRFFGLHVVRNLFHFSGQYAWVYAIGLLPLATVFAIEFTMPVWVALLAFFVLGERLNQGRVVMLILGLAGIAIILRPGVGAFHPAALVMVLGSVFYAGNIIMTKRLSATDAPLSVLFWMSVVQIPPTLAAALPQWVTPRLADLPWILAIGGGSYAAHYSLTRAMKLGDATLVMPIDFLRLPLIAVIGALAYAEPLEAAVFVGAAVIFAGTYYSLARESRRA